MLPWIVAAETLFAIGFACLVKLDGKAAFENEEGAVVIMRGQVCLMTLGGYYLINPQSVVDVFSNGSRGGSELLSLGASAVNTVAFVIMPAVSVVAMVGLALRHQASNSNATRNTQGPTPYEGGA